MQGLERVISTDVKGYPRPLPSSPSFSDFLIHHALHRGIGLYRLLDGVEHMMRSHLNPVLTCIYMQGY